MRKKIWKFWAEFVENKGEYENNTWKKNIKRYTRKEKGKWKTLIVKEKKPEYLSAPKIFYNCKFHLFQFCHV